MNAPVKVETKGYIGKRMARTEDTRLLTGRGVYTDDVHLPGMLHVAFHRSPIARGRIKDIALSEAREERKRVVKGKSVSVRGALGGRRRVKKKKNKQPKK